MKKPISEWDLQLSVQLISKWEAACFVKGSSECQTDVLMGSWYWYPWHLWMCRMWNTANDLYSLYIFGRKWCHRWRRREVPRFVPLMIDIVLITELWLHRLVLLCIVPDQSHHGRRQLSHKGTSFVVVLFIRPNSSADKKTERKPMYKIWTYTVVTRTQHPTLKTRFCLMAIKILCCIEIIYHTGFIRSRIQCI